MDRCRQVYLAPLGRSVAVLEAGEHSFRLCYSRDGAT